MDGRIMATKENRQQTLKAGQNKEMKRNVSDLFYVIINLYYLYRALSLRLPPPNKAIAAYVIPALVLTGCNALRRSSNMTDEGSTRQKYKIQSSLCIRTRFSLAA